MATRVMFYYFVLHLIALFTTSGAEDTAIGDGNNYCTKDDLLNIRLTVSNLRDRVLDQKHDILEQKNEIYDMKMHVSATGKNVDETSIELKYQLSSQNNTLYRQAEETEDLRRGLTSLVQQQNNKLDRQAEEIENLRRGLTSLVQQQNNKLDRQAEEIENLRHDLTSLKQQQNDSLYRQAEEIHELKRVVIFLEQQLNDTSLLSCPSGYIRFQRSCYKFHNETKLFWSESVAYCKGHGSSLVMFDTMAEYEFLMSFIKTSGIKDAYWTAATDADNEGVWTWGRNGTSAKFLPWATGQPNDNGDCVELNFRSAVNDQPCNAKRFPLCEKNLKTIT